MSQDKSENFGEKILLVIAHQKKLVLHMLSDRENVRTSKFW
jgi:hypothetical protein